MVETARRKKAESATQPDRAAVWDEACKLVLIRTDPARIYTGPIESGVNYFVLMLEQLGAETHYSCEGHPEGFYIVFKAPLRVAEKVHACGFFSVELESKGLWSLRLNRRQLPEKERISVLRWAAEAWEKKLGPSSWRVIPKE